MGRGNRVMFWEYKLGAPSRWRLQIGFLNPPVKFNPELDQGGEKLILGSMQTCPALLLLLLAACALPARCSAPQPSCLHFSELLPAKLKELRITFEKIKDYFVSITLSSFSFYLFFCCKVQWFGWGGRQLPPGVNDLVVSCAMGWGGSAREVQFRRWVRDNTQEFSS